MHVALGVWKARSVLAEAVAHLSDTLPSTACVDAAVAEELRTAIEAIEATESRLRQTMASELMSMCSRVKATSRGM